jgi:NitT/TauT family transport system ATP-binding protein
MNFACHQISKTFTSRKGKINALRGIDFSVINQDFVCIVGPSGCGKTTLLKIIAGLIQPTSGEVTFTDSVEKGKLRSAMVFQDLGLFPWMSVLDNVALGLEIQGVGRRERQARASVFLARVGLASFIHSFPHELSGGMRQRVAILRAFLSDPQVLLMDEPFGSLDTQTRLVMQEELLRVWKDYHKTVIYVTHDIDEAILLGDRILVMSGRPGSIRADIPVEFGRPRQLADRDRPDLVSLHWQIWKIIEDEVRKEVGIVQ